MDVDLLISAFVLLSSLSVLWQCRDLQLGYQSAAEMLHRAAVHQREILQMAETQRQLAGIQSFTENTVEGSTSTIRSVHREIASIPFDILESIPVTKDTTRLVRGIHDLTSDGVYSGISVLNRFLGKQVRRSIHQTEQETNGPEDQDSSDL